MKRMGFAAVALAAAMTVACGGGARDEANDVDPNASVGTGGEIAEDRDIAGADNRRSGASGDVQEFVREASMHGTAEVELGRLASERAQNAEVKKFAQMMVREHTQANSELKAAAGSHNLQVQEQMDEKHRDLAERLRGLRGAEFDREYMNAMVDGHEEVKGMLEEQAREMGHDTTVGTTGANAENTRAGQAGQHDAAQMAVSQWAAKTLPAVNQHLQQATQISDRLENSNQRNRTN
jgi:putative membrane protein